MMMRWIVGLFIVFLVWAVPVSAANVTPVNLTMNVDTNMSVIYLTDDTAGQLSVSPVHIVVSNITTDGAGKNTAMVVACNEDTEPAIPRTLTFSAANKNETLNGTYTVSVVTVKTGTFLPVNNMNFSTSPSRTTFFKQTIADGAKETWVDLAWPDMKSPLDLMVYAPDATLGPFNDTADGIVDHRIFINVAGEKNVTPGDWYYRVRNAGDDATPYTLNTYTS